MLAALETVWESLFQDAASPAPSLQLPTLPSTSLTMPVSKVPRRHRNRLGDAPGRLTS